MSDLTDLAEELGRYEALAELVQGWQASEGDPGRAMVLSIRRADALPGTAPSSTVSFSAACSDIRER